MIETKINQTWEKLEKLAPHSLQTIRKEHLEYSDYTIEGYWDEDDNFYEKIAFTQPVSVKISNYSICRTLKQDHNEDVIKLDFFILADRCDQQLDKAICGNKNTIDNILKGGLRCITAIA